MPSQMGDVVAGCYNHADAASVSTCPCAHLFSWVSVREQELSCSSEAFSSISQQVSPNQWVSAKKVHVPESAFSGWKEEIPIISAYYKWIDWEYLAERLYPSHLVQCGSKNV